MRNVVISMYSTSNCVQCGTLRLVYSILRLRGTRPSSPGGNRTDRSPRRAPLPRPRARRPLTKNTVRPARTRARLSLCDPASSLARRCRGGDISRMCLADRNQCICPAAPEPRVTPCAPWPARRACLAVSRIRIQRAHTLGYATAGLRRRCEVSAQQPRYLDHYIRLRD